MALGEGKEEAVGDSGQIILRPAALSDSYTILKWRNDPLSVKNSLTGKRVDLKDHESWYAKSLNDADREVYLAELYDAPVGVIRFDPGADNVAIVSIIVAPGWRGLGIGRRILQQGCLMKADWMLSALIKKTNKASISIFEGCGFCLVTEADDGVQIYCRGRLLL